MRLICLVQDKTVLLANNYIFCMSFCMSFMRLSTKSKTTIKASKLTKHAKGELLKLFEFFSGIFSEISRLF
jgi:hypothetical protein